MTDIPAAQAQLDQLVQNRRDLEREQQARPDVSRNFEISNALTRIEGEEQLLKLRLYLSGHAANSLEFMQQLDALNTTMSETANWMWRDVARVLLAFEAQRTRRNARYRRSMARSLSATRRSSSRWAS